VFFKLINDNNLLFGKKTNKNVKLDNAPLTYFIVLF
jgi:hypothetical protein